ncbi:hypothetical protein ACHHV8_33445 [Paenibacillus sp. TAB 01]|uniref:hypothetical protein n=1 Tax=Paenibacillus sp. TAB 01 TaxID=3368988 RepID=UPI0037538E5A
MKEAIIVNLAGYMTDVTLVADHVTGVFPIYARPEPAGMDQEEAELPEPEITGYTVAVPVQAVLYKPRFDFEAWEAYQEALEAYNAEMAAWLNTAEEDRGEEPLLEQPSFWIEGLTQEEIDALKNQPVPKSLQEQLDESLALTVQLRQELAVQKDINAANSADFMSLVDYLAEKGVLD